MKSLLSVLGILFLLVAAGAGIGLATLPAGRLKAAVTALKGAEPSASPAPGLPVPAPTATSDTSPVDAALLTEARAKLLEAKEDFRQERAMAAAPSSRPAAALADKGAKSVAELSAKMSPKDVVHLLQDESEAEVARVLGKMDARQAGKVMAELVTADADRARKVIALMKEGIR